MTKVFDINVLSVHEDSFPEVAKVGSYRVTKAIPHDDARHSFNVSMLAIMGAYKDRMLLNFEEDVRIGDMAHFQQALSELPDDWELCYLGANITDRVEAYSPHLVRCYGCWTSHGVLYNITREIAENYDTAVMFDDWLKVNVHPRGNTYIIRPFIAYQMPHYTRLWSMNADYSELFRVSNNKAMEA